MKKKRRFTKLELVLISFVLLIIAGLFIYSKSSNFNIVNLFDKKTALQQRYERLNYLIDNRQIGTYYDEFVPPKAKSKKSRDDFISEAGNKEAPKYTTTVHNITIKDNIGYIERTRIECTDVDCTNKIDKRIYKKWELIDGNWYPAGEESCIRDTPYSISPEFERAISLYKQRIEQREGPGGLQWLNCVDIQYDYIPDAEGYFTFDQNSTVDRLTIFVDNSYKIKDDLLTAFLLSHELNHAYNFIYNRAEGILQPCYDAEIVAFLSQLDFFSFSLNNEERSSLIYRIPTLQYNKNSPIQLVKTFGDITNSAFLQCGGFEDYKCINNVKAEQISQMVRSNPYYQKQCGSN